MNADGCIWIGRGEREGAWEGESMRDLGKRRHGLGEAKDRFKLVLLFEIKE